MSAPSETIWCAVEKDGRSDFEAVAHEYIRICDRLISVRDRYAGAAEAGRFNGSDFCEMARQVVNLAVAAVDSLNLDETMPAMEQIANCPALPNLPIEQDAEFIRQRDLLLAAELRPKDVQKELQRRGWPLV